MSATSRMIDLAARSLPKSMRRWLRDKQREQRIQWPRAGTVDFGNLRRLTPVSRVFGYDRGLPIDRYYIEHFLKTHSKDIHGRVLEMGDASYTRKFGGAQVKRSDVLHVVAGNPEATIVADLTRAENVASDLFDCIILTQTIQMIYNARAAAANLHRILKPGGVLLLTAHGITKIARREGIDAWGEYWHFTSQSLAKLLGESFPASNVQITVYGNVLTATAALQGLAAQELTHEELHHPDPDYEVLLAARAVKL